MASSDDLTKEREDAKDFVMDDNVCKDFQRNVCFRGSSCKFKHPGEEENSPIKLTFCGNFQRRGCKLRHCQYIHAERSAEQRYLATGILPDDIRRHIIESYGLCMKFLRKECSAESCSWKHTNLRLEVPDEALFSYYYILRQCGVCRNYLRGECDKKDDECKYKHTSPEDCGLGNLTWSQVYSRIDFDQGLPQDRKRSRMDDGFYGGGEMCGNMGMMGGMGNQSMGYMGGGSNMMGGGPRMEEIVAIHRENRMLRMENEELKRRLSSCNCRPACQCSGW